MGSRLDSKFSSGSLTNTNSESPEQRIARLEAELTALRQDNVAKEWMMRKRLEEEVFGEPSYTQISAPCSTTTSAIRDGRPAFIIIQLLPRDCRPLKTYRSCSVEEILQLQ
jgi:hypothetical protein